MRARCKRASSPGRASRRAATALAPSLAFALVGMGLVGAASVAFQSTGNSTLQLAAAPHMRGRVMALWAVAFLGSTPIGGPIAGFVSQHLGGRAGLALGAAACLVAAVLTAVVAHREQPDGRDTTDGAAKAPHMDTARPQSGQGRRGRR